MYYLCKYDYIEQLKHKIRLGFKLNDIEIIIFTFYCINLSFKIIDFIQSKEFKYLLKEFK